MKKLLSFIFILSMTHLLVGCGQYGKLYLPQTPAKPQMDQQPSSIH